MRKTWTKLLVVLLVAAFLTACQATPDEPVVVQKDMEQMIEKAGATYMVERLDKSLKESTGAPDTFEISDTSGALTLTADAPVIVPDAGSMPILNVTSTVFSQETVNKFWDVLVGDTTMWEWSDQPTKDEITQMIVNQKKLKADVEQEGDTEIIEGYDDLIAELEKMYQTAPESIEVTTASSQLKEKVNWDPVLGTIDTRYMGTSGYSVKSQADMGNAEDWIYFCASNPWTGEEGRIKSDISPAIITFEAAAINNNYSNAMPVTEGTVLDDSVASLLTTTPEQAKKIVEDFLERTDTRMAVYSMALIDDSYPYEGKEAQHYAYRVTCIRTVSGLPVTTPLGYGADSMMFIEGYQPKNIERSYTVQWSYESMLLEFDDNGFFQITWQSPLEIGDTEVEGCTLLPFNDIADVFKKMLPISYEPNIADGYSMVCDVLEVRLEMMRVRKQNSDQVMLEGLIIPVWTFYGELLLYDSSGEVKDGSGSKTNILSINAVDGSVINTGAGY